MAKEKSKQASLLIFTLITGLLSQSLVIPVISAASFEDQKTYYPPGDPHADESPPKGSHHTPSHGSHGHKSSPPSNCGTPPSGGHYDPAPPTGDSPPTIISPPTSPSIDPGTPSTPPTIVSPPTSPSIDPDTPTSGSPPTYGSPPTSPSIDPGTPSTPTYESPPSTLSPPSTPIDPGTPSTPTYGSPPSTPIDPDTPSTPTYGSPPTTISPPSTPIDPGTPLTPTYGSPPSTPIDPGTPGSPIFPVTPTTPGISSPPFSFSPNSPPFPCTYWLTHPTIIWGMLGYYGATLGGAFGLTSNGSPAAVSQLSLERALSNTRTDGIGALYREGTGALLNSMVIKRFPFTSEQVRDRFVSALGSNKAATEQARVFKMANEGRLKPRL